MEIKNTPELLAAIEKSNELTAQLAKFETTKTALEAANKELSNTKKELSTVTKEKDLLETENGELKQAAVTAETAKPEPVVVEAVEKVIPEEAAATTVETVKPVELEVVKPTEAVKPVEIAAKVESMEQLNATLTAKNAEIANLKEKAEAFMELAVNYADVAETVQDQFQLLSQALGLPKGKIPETVEAGPKEKESEAYKTYKTLSLSNNPEDKRAARLLKKSNPEIAEQVGAAPDVPVRPVVAKSSMTEADAKIIADWRNLVAQAKTNEKSNPMLHAQQAVEARRLKRQHADLINAAIA